MAAAATRRNMPFGRFQPPIFTVFKSYPQGNRGMIYPVFRVLFPNQVIPADDLARAMVDVAVREAAVRGGVVLENRDIRVMVKSL